MERVLIKAALEDLNEHGRLLVLKDHLLSLVDREERLGIKTLSVFQLKDFTSLDEDLARELSADSSTYEEISQELDHLELSPKDASKAIKKRHSALMFP